MTNAEVEVPRRAVVRLVRFGFEDGERAARLLSDPDLGLWDLERNEPADPEAGPVVAAEFIFAHILTVGPKTSTTLDGPDLATSIFP